MAQVAGWDLGGCEEGDEWLEGSDEESFYTCVKYLVESRSWDIGGDLAVLGSV
jgi:hypothetical protein